MLVAILEERESFVFLTNLRVASSCFYQGPALLEVLAAFAQKGREAIRLEGVLDGLSLLRVDGLAQSDRTPSGLLHLHEPLG